MIGDIPCTAEAGLEVEMILCSTPANSWWWWWYSVDGPGVPLTQSRSSPLKKGHAI